MSNLSDVPDNPAPPEMEIREFLLGFLGLFSHVQDLVDNVVAPTFFRRRIPMAADVVLKRTISRIKDEERVDLVLAIAAELNTDADLDSFKAVYMRVKRLRDKIAHSARFKAIDEDRMSIEKTMLVSIDESREAPIEVDRIQIGRAAHDCNWLQAQVLYIISADGEPIELAGQRQSASIIKPPAVPEGWDGVWFRRPTSA